MVDSDMCSMKMHREGHRPLVSVGRGLGITWFSFFLFFFCVISPSFQGRVSTWDTTGMQGGPNPGLDQIVEWDDGTTRVELRNLSGQ